MPVNGLFGFLDGLRELNIWSVTLRLLLAMLLGGLIGMERGRKRRAAGFRTYLLICLGAALTMMLGMFLADRTINQWSELQTALGGRTDVTRLGARVVSGIGFLGAGTIIVTGRREVKGLTTTAGLWVSACMGLAVGAGFYEAVLLCFVFMLISMRVLPAVEIYIIENSRNMTVYTEFESMDDLGGIINCVKAQDVQILDVEVAQGGTETQSHPSASFVLRLKHKIRHAELLAAISGAEGIHLIEEL